MLNHYETLVLMSPELAEENRKEILANLTGIIERDGGTIGLVDDWGIRTLAYPVRKLTRGHYVRLDYVAPGALVAELERNIRITDGLFKFVTVRLDDAPAAAPSAEEA
ncbi:MAG: 30S ribosomal protein S6 [Humidesulfovibrio sp.]|jgi:small subunit ribosomal protein S6|uniref:30S ribosomal protein S6 n=1 Tax=Humidesulfovibrio sp. TaxID=2910988 RepID=UPI00273461F5|nr:30S ribosomal protein S6 [Humidesulfovibrio sp.]MDP2848867.1 30S ribosomal protein S6 [Humidesulfovibrio sp.]